MTKRILKEFWLPLVVAILWTSYNLYSRSETWTARDVINVFGPSFFLASWATGQYFRIRKQTKVESGLNTIDSRVEDLVTKLETHTNNFIGYATGGDANVSFSPLFRTDDLLELGLENLDKFPVFDIQTQLIDLDEPIDRENRKYWTRQRYSLSSLYPSKAVLGAYKFDIKDRAELNLNIFIQTRNSNGSQQIRYRKHDGKQLIAMHTVLGDKEEFSVPDDFPGYDKTDPSKLFS